MYGAVKLRNWEKFVISSPSQSGLLDIGTHREQDCVRGIFFSYASLAHCPMFCHWRQWGWNSCDMERLFSTEWLVAQWSSVSTDYMCVFRVEAYLCNFLYKFFGENINPTPYPLTSETLKCGSPDLARTLLYDSAFIFFLNLEQSPWTESLFNLLGHFWQT